MWNIILSILMVIASFVDASNDCLLHSYYVCGVDGISEHFPGSKQELYSQCKIEMKFFKCVIKTEEECETDPEFIQYHYDLLAATRDMCNKESPLHPVVLDNLACVKPIFEDYSSECFNSFTGHGRRKYVKALRREGIPAFTKDKEDKEECLRGLHIFVCDALRIEEKCGTSAMKSFIRIIHTRTMETTKTCNPKIKRHLLDIVRVFKQEQIEEDHLEPVVDINSDENA